MADNIIHNYYFPFLRRGLGASIAPREVPVDNDGQNVEQRASVDVAFTVQVNPLKDNTTEREVSQKVELYGPGDVLGFDAQKMILRVQPTVDDGNFIPNNVPFVEFKEADFPWRYSATQVDGNWIPWLTLVTLKMEDTGEPGEFEEDNELLPGLPNRIKLKEGTKLPDLTASWRWAHVSCQATAGKSVRWLKQKIISDNGFAIARLLCPRRFRAGVKYTTFVVPTYLLGGQVALGKSTDGTDRSQLAWQGTGQSTDLIFTDGLPYYYRWEFRTGLRGDFEQMVRLIQPRPLQALGGKVVNIDNPGYGIGNQDDGSIKRITIEGALQSTDANDSTVSSVEKGLIEETASRLVGLLNKSEGDQEDDIPRVVPPIYGRWINHRETADDILSLPDVDELISGKPWLESVNLNLRYRIPAGLGVQYVKEHQEELMSAAWDQLERVQQENRLRNLGRFGREISSCLHKRLDQVKNAQTFVSLAEPVSGKIAFSEADAQTLFHIPPSPILITTTVGNSYFSDKLSLRTQLLKSNIANSRITVKWRKYSKGNLPISRPIGTDSSLDQYRLNSVVAQTVGNSRLTVSTRSWPVGQIGSLPRGEFDLVALRDIISDRLLPKHTIEQRLLASLGISRTDDDLQEDVLGPAMAYPEFHDPMYKYLLGLSEDYFVPNLDQVPQNTISALITNRKFIEAFLLGLNHEFSAELRWRGYPTDLRGSYFRKFWDTTIYSMDEEEKKQFRESVYGIDLQATMGLDWSEIEESFFQLTNEQVADRYEEMVEKWMLTRDEDKEIKPLENWEANTDLGEHAVPNEDGSGNQADNEVVLMIRAELLRKYPNTFIYLLESTENEGRRELKSDGSPVYPIFEANLPPDIVCLGFPLSEPQAREHFIVFEERLSEQRFGLDITKAEESPGSIQNLSWEHFPAQVGEEGFLDNYEPADTSASLKWNSAPFVARVFTQQPVRMAVDLDSLMPS